MLEDFQTVSEAAFSEVLMQLSCGIALGPVLWRAYFYVPIWGLVARCN